VRVMRLILAVLGASLACSCGAARTAEPPDTVGAASDVRAAYVFLGADRFEVDMLVEPVTSCGEAVPCSPGGLAAGLNSFVVSPVSGEGWALELVFSSDLSVEEVGQLQRLLKSRASELGLDEVTFLGSDDEWPSCRQQPECLTVEESLSG